MERNALVDLLVAATATGGATALLGFTRAQLADGRFRMVGSAMAAGFVLIASLVWKTGVLEWLVGPDPKFLPAVLVVLAVAAVQAVASPGATIEEPRLNRNARRAVAALPVAQWWNERVVAWALGVTRNHFGLAAERATTEVFHRGDADRAGHTAFDWQNTIVLRQPAPSVIRLAVELVPEVPAGESRSRFGPFSSVTHQLAECSTITLYPLVADAEAARAVLESAIVSVEAWGTGGAVALVAPAKDETLSIAEGSGPPFSHAARRWLFDIRINSATHVRMKVEKLLHTDSVPVIYFQPEFVVLDEWTFRAQACNGVRLLSPAILDGQMPNEGEVEVSESRIALALSGGIQMVDGRSVRLPVMPWTTLHYLLQPRVSPTVTPGSSGELGS
jgi:hypothetical protein